ncbi:transposase [Amycolatopsis ultiminotia]|uniref:transposase n=1 Tax=Amycolatopsis ultiminotia TaxID=543629 RepID=UPI003CD0631D
MIEGLLPVQAGKPGRPFSDAREMVEGMICQYACGLAWRDVPPVFWSVAVALDPAPEAGPRGHLACGAAAVARDGRRCARDRLGHLGRSHHCPRASARHQHHPRHGGFVELHESSDRVA